MELYFKKINYDYKEEFKKIEGDNKEIGYIVRSSDVSSIDYFISKTKEKNIKKNFQTKNYPSDNNRERYRNNPQKRNQSEDKSRKQLSIDFPMKMVQNNVYQSRMPLNFYISNKDNTVSPINMDYVGPLQLLSEENKHSTIFKFYI